MAHLLAPPAGGMELAIDFRILTVIDSPRR
jgi:hypothetical protein